MVKLLKILFVGLSLICVNASCKEKFPEGTVTIISALPAGSGPDSILRKVNDVLTKKWNVPVVVINVPGGNGAVAINQYSIESKNGYAILLLDAGQVIGYPILNHDPTLLDNIEPLAPLVQADMALITSTNIKTFDELVGKLKTNANYGSWAVGSTSHLAGAEFGSIYSNNPTHIAYKEYGMWYIDVYNQILSYSFSSLGSSKAMRDASKIHVLGLASSKRDPRNPSIPTIKELTGKEIISQSWVALYINKNVSASIKKTLETDIRQATNDVSVQQFIGDYSFHSLAGMPLDEFNKMVNGDRTRYINGIKKYNISIN